MTKPRVLFVDDEPNVLSAIKRGLRGDFDVHTADGGDAALAAINAAKGDEAFAVIVSDCRMPKMDGIELLERVSKIAPTCVRVMLTGNADQATAVRAVNTGDVFKFLNKPCDPEELKRVVAQAVRQHELITAERELMEKTVKGCIKVLADLLGIVNPEVFGRAGRLRRKARDLAAHLEGVKAWELDAAALLSQLGCVNVAEEILDKFHRGEALNEREAADLSAHPLLGADLIGQIPRLGNVAKIVLYQHKNFDGTGFPIDDVKESKIPLEARALHTVLRYDELSVQGWSDAAIIDKLRKMPGKHDPAVLDALAKSVGSGPKDAVVRVPAADLKEGMVIQEDVKTDKGMMLLCHGQEVTQAIREHLLKFQRAGLLKKPILVTVPAAADPVRATA